MASGKVRLRILTPEGIFWDKDVDIVNVKTATGMMGILPDKSPLIVPILVSELIIGHTHDEANREVCAISGGMLFARPDEIRIMTEAIEFRDRIDLARAEAAKKRTELLLKAEIDVIEEFRLKTQLDRSINRINVKKGL